MTTRILTAVATLFMCVTVFAGEQPLRVTLERTWKDYLAASKSGQESELAKTMSSYRLGMMKNNLASAKQALTPEIIKSIALHMPEISTARFVDLIEQGPTAALVYIRDSEETDITKKPRVSFVFIKFVKEASIWKVDAGMDIGSSKFQDDGKESKFAPSDLPPTYEIDGNVRLAPDPITPPYASAFLDVFSPNHKTEITVNGIEQEATVDKSHSGLLKGGLRKGKNSIVIVVTRTKEDAVFEPRVTVRRILEDRKMEEVFKFEPKENIGGKHTLSFMIEE